MKEIINKTKGSLHKKVFANDIFDKGLSKISEELTKLNPSQNKTNNPVKKWAEDVNTPISREDIQMAHTHEKILNITHHHLGNTNQNYNEIPPHTCQNG